MEALRELGDVAVRPVGKEDYSGQSVREGSTLYLYVRVRGRAHGAVRFSQRRPDGRD